MRTMPARSRLTIKPAAWYPPGEGWHWYDWDVALGGGKASGSASSYKRAHKLARKALRQLAKGNWLATTQNRKESND